MFELLRCCYFKIYVSWGFQCPHCNSVKIKHYWFFTSLSVYLVILTAGGGKKCMQSVRKQFCGFWHIDFLWKVFYHCQQLQQHLPGKGKYHKKRKEKIFKKVVQMWESSLYFCQPKCCNVLIFLKKKKVWNKSRVEKEIL